MNTLADLIWWNVSGNDLDLARVKLGSCVVELLGNLLGKHST